MDGITLQQRIYSGYAKAALRIGTTFNLYRSASAIDPLASGNLLGNLLSSANVNWEYTKANKYSNPIWQMIVDGSQVQVFDYLIGSSTFFIIAMQPLLPILAVSCNRTILIKRPTQPTGVGAVGYGGYQDSTASIIYQSCPASILEGTKGQESEFKVPTDIKMNWWKVLLPYLGGVTIQTGDIITDDLGTQYEISSAELSDLGWRLTAFQLGS